MKGRAAILGLGTRGTRWAEACLAAGWDVQGFDPDDRAGGGISTGASWRREGTISGAVSGAELVICCLPERLELVRTVVQRAQAAAAMDAMIAVASDIHDIDAVQGCAIRPTQVVRLLEGEGGDLALDVSSQNNSDIRERATNAVAELSAAASVRLDAIPVAPELPESREA